MKKYLTEKYRARYRTLRNEINLGFRICWAKFIRLFWKPCFPKLENRGIRLNLGCGNINYPDFINIDLMPASHVHYVRGIDNLKPFKNNSVDLIYACHCLEHFSYLEVQSVLCEWYRVLKPGGSLMISVPDFDLLLNIYDENKKDINSIISRLMGGQDNKYNYHKTVFTKSSLSLILIKVGFKNIFEWDPNACQLSTINDWSRRTISVNGKEYRLSLNIEARK